MGQDIEFTVSNIDQYGADMWHHVYARVGQPQLARLINDKILASLETPLGLVVVLGSKGRNMIGKVGTYKMDPNAAASSVLRRLVREQLENDQWEFLAYVDPRQTLMYFQSDDHSLIVSCHYPDLSPQTLSAYIERYLNGLPYTRLLFTALEPKLYKALLKKDSRLSMLAVNLLLPPFSL
jgi:hypothetical protein